MVIAETSDVLSKNYGIACELVIDALIGLIARESISVLELPKHLVIEALELCRPPGEFRSPTPSYGPRRERQATAPYTRLIGVFQTQESIDACCPE